MNRSPTILDRRSILSGLSLAALAAPALAAPPKRMTAYKTPWCGCCGGWIAHMRQAGWTVEVVEREDLAPVAGVGALLEVPDEVRGRGRRARWCPRATATSSSCGAPAAWSSWTT